ncbi:hypothetical protein P7L53_16785 [Thermoleptolyngbya sichuanensis XZ-Cy5]|uniref:hypothetical protein n=1 Tax=Thermoleptolyngbya sichuanensis TaxID=2885951 RepID=UPI00240E3553|nr:hypothetical protein [Thermoleptolyngbya sichuanensis]MDG2617898.1 hypothetical protein [Thermoleptolyngbya sichuanensis XZ-Cy5]
MLTTFPIEQFKMLQTDAQNYKDPMSLLKAFPALRIKPDYVLRLYYHYSHGDGIGAVWAFRNEDAPPENWFIDDEEIDEEIFRGGTCDIENLKERGMLKPGNRCKTLKEVFQKPDGALDDFMEAIEGDGTPWSYLSASLFAREAPELGASWHGCSWSARMIFGKDPDELRRAGDSPFQWLVPKPKMWLPSCQDEGDTVIVQFYSHTLLEGERVIQHRDVYQKGSYVSRYEGQDIATGDGFMIF